MNAPDIPTNSPEENYQDENNSKTSSILIIDDQPANLAVIGHYLADYGFVVLVSQDGESGLQRAEYVKPDLILLDVLMPGIDGFETCRRLKSNEITKEIPVIFMTALTDTFDKVKGFQMGGVDYIIKPVQQEEVLARIKTHLKIREQQEQLQKQTTTLTQANIQLEQEIRERVQARNDLQKAHEELEKLVVERTAELAQTNASLNEEIAERKRAENMLRKRNAELESFERMAVGRELKMIELKNQINELENQLRNHR